MGIYIKGVELPAEGVLCIDIFPDGRVAGHYDCTNKQAKAVPVPAHGRLIDGEALAAKCDSPHWCVWLSDIDAAPTIISAEEEEA